MDKSVKNKSHQLNNKEKNSFYWRNDTQKVFEQAIREGRLSLIPNTHNFVYEYMYMGTLNGKDLFKHRLNRNYLK